MANENRIYRTSEAHAFAPLSSAEGVKDVTDVTKEHEGETQETDLTGVLLVEDQDYGHSIGELRMDAERRFEELMIAATAEGVSRAKKNEYYNSFRSLLEELDGLKSFLKAEYIKCYNSLRAQGVKRKILENVYSGFSRQAGELQGLINHTTKRTNEITNSLLEPIDRGPDNEDVVQEVLGVDTDELFAEKETLETRVSFYQEIVKNILYKGDDNALSPKEVKRAFDRVLYRLYTETDIMRPFEEEGVELFTEDLRVQPDFPGLEAIKFTSHPYKLSPEDKALIGSASKPEDIKNLAEKGIVCDDEIDLAYLQHAVKVNFGGVFQGQPGHKRIYINEQQPDLETRIRDFLKNGGISGASAALVHEIRHYQQDVSRGSETPPHDGELALMEAQSYIQHSLSYFQEQMFGIVYHLCDPDGGYRLDPDMVIQALEAIERLNAMGLSQAEIAEFISKVQCDDDSTMVRIGPPRPQYENLDVLMKEEMNKREIGENDADALRDVFRVQRRVRHLKILDIARQELFKIAGEERLNECAKHVSPYVFSIDSPNPVLKLMDCEQSSILSKTGFQFSVAPDGKLEVLSFTARYDEDGKLEDFQSQTLDKMREGAEFIKKFRGRFDFLSFYYRYSGSLLSVNSKEKFERLEVLYDKVFEYVSRGILGHSEIQS